MSVRTPLPEPDREAKRTLVYVALYRRKHGVGPTWRELGEAMGWPRGETPARIRAFYPYGLRWRRGIARSLTVPDPVLRRILRAPEPSGRKAT